MDVTIIVTTFAQIPYVHNHPLNKQSAFLCSSLLRMGLRLMVTVCTYLAFEACSV